jgi:hypothetical protein
MKVSASLQLALGEFIAEAFTAKNELKASMISVGASIIQVFLLSGGQTAIITVVVIPFGTLGTM